MAEANFKRSTWRSRTSRTSQKMPRKQQRLQPHKRHYLFRLVWTAPVVRLRCNQYQSVLCWQHGLYRSQIEAMYPACVAVGISQGDCCPNVDHVKLGCCDGFPKAAEDCRRKDGESRMRHVWSRCDVFFPYFFSLQDVKITPGTECSKFPACAASNMTGACCPTADGLQLACCSSIWACD